MLPQHARGAAIVVVLLTLLPGALASHDPNQPLEVHKPDLYPSSPRFTETDELHPTDVCMEVYNFAPANQGISGFFDVQMRIEQYVNGSAYLWKEEYQRTTSPISGGQQATMCWRFTLPAGGYLASASVDVANEVDESNETNNAHTRGYWFGVRERPKPDLVVVSKGFAIGPGDGANGYPQYFQVQVRNRGDAPSVATEVEFRDETGVLGRGELRALAAGGYGSAFIQTDPTLRPPGAYTAVATLDPDGLVDEHVETDNVATRAYVIVPHPAPDLVVRDLRINGTLVERRALRLEAVVANVGNKSAGTTTYRLDIDGAPVANQTLDRLSAGANRTLVFPFYLTSGNHTVRVVADPLFAIGELDETNNDRDALVMVDAIPPDLRFPNLVIDRLSALPDDPGPGEVVTVNAYLRNVGEVPSDNLTLALVLDGVRIGEVRVPPIQPDRYHSARFEWTNATVGPHTLRAYVDANAEVREIHEDDNNDTLFLTILQPRVEQAPPVNGTTTPPPAEDETPPNEGDGNEPGSTAPPPTNATDDARGPEITQVDVTTRPVPGALKGRITVGLRNPRLDALGRMTVAFKVDGRALKEVLVQGIPAAGLTGTSSGEVDLPPGKHDVQVEVRLVGAATPPAVSAATYDAQAGENGVPGPSLGLVVLAVAALALRRKKSDG